MTVVLLLCPLPFRTSGSEIIEELLYIPFLPLRIEQPFFSFSKHAVTPENRWSLAKVHYYSHMQSTA